MNPLCVRVKRKCLISKIGLVHGPAATVMLFLWAKAFWFRLTFHFLDNGSVVWCPPKKNVH